MEIILSALLVIGIIAFIAYPLFNPSRETLRVAGASNGLDALIAQRDSTYDAIRDLDFDFQLGKLSHSDYAALRDKYKARAAQMLKQLDELGVGHNVDAEAQIEAQIAQLRRAKADTLDDEIAHLRSSSKSSEMRCANCGTPHHAGDKFCSKCGKKLSHDES